MIGCVVDAVTCSSSEIVTVGFAQLRRTGDLVIGGVLVVMIFSSLVTRFVEIVL